MDRLAMSNTCVTARRDDHRAYSLLAILLIGAVPSRARSPARVAAGPSRVTRGALAGDLARLHMERRQDGPLLQIAHLALIVATLSRCGEPRGQLVRRRRCGPEGLRAAGGAQARNVTRNGPPGDRRKMPAPGQRHPRA